MLFSPNGNFITDTIYYDSQKNKYFDLKGYNNLSTKVSCNQVFKDTPNPLFIDSIHSLFKATESPYSFIQSELKLTTELLMGTYITEKSGYAEERINISNAIIYYDMINKSDHGFNSGMNSTDINLDSGSVFLHLRLKKQEDI